MALDILSTGDCDEAVDARVLIKLGFGGTGGFDLPSTELELVRRRLDGP